MVERDIMVRSIFELRKSRDLALNLPDVLVIRMVEVNDLFPISMHFTSASARVSQIEG